MSEQHLGLENFGKKGGVGVDRGNVGVRVVRFCWKVSKLYFSFWASQ